MNHARLTGATDPNMSTMCHSEESYRQNWYLKATKMQGRECARRYLLKMIRAAGFSSAFASLDDTSSMTENAFSEDVIYLTG